MENSSDLLLSPLNMLGGFPISLSLPLPGSSTGARLAPGDPPPLPPGGFPPPGGSPPLPGGPPPGNPPP